MLVGVAFALGALLAAVLPTAREYQHDTDGLSADAYSLAYLGVLSRATPRDEHTRLALARRFLALGQYDAALLAAGADGDRARGSGPAESLRLDVLLARARSIPEGTPARREAFDAVGRQLLTVRAFPQTAARLRELATIALELPNPRLGAELLVDAARVAPRDERARLFAAAGRWMRASGDIARAVECFREAEELAPDPQSARDFAVSALDALEADARVAEAADLAASFVKKYGDDAVILDRAATLAAYANRVTVAREFGRRLIRLSPDNEELIRKQVRLELAAADPRAALPLVTRLVAQHPTDVRWREVEARVAEWAGSPALALSDWLWLVGRGVGGSVPFAIP